MTRSVRKPRRTRAYPPTVAAAAVVKKEAAETVAVPRGGACAGRGPTPRRRTRKHDPRANANTAEARAGKRALKPERVASASHEGCGHVSSTTTAYRVVPTGEESGSRPKHVREDKASMVSDGNDTGCVVMEFVNQYCAERGLPVERKDEQRCAELLDVESKAGAAREDFKVRRREHDEREYYAKINARKSMKNYKPNPKADKQDIRTMNNRRSASARRVYDVVFEAELLHKIDETYNNNEELVRKIEAVKREGAEVRKETNMLRRTHALRMALHREATQPNHVASSPPTKDDSSPPPTPPSRLQLGMPQLADDDEFVGGDEWERVNQLDDVAHINGFEMSPVSTRDSVNLVDTPMRCAKDDELVESFEDNFDVLVPLGVDGQPMSSSQEEAVLKSMFPSQ